MADEYEEYNYDDKFYAESGSRKGKSKKEANQSAKAQASSGAKPGQERKVAEAISNSEQKRKEENKEKWFIRSILILFLKWKKKTIYLILMLLNLNRIVYLLEIYY